MKEADFMTAMNAGKNGSVTPLDESGSADPPGILRDPAILIARKWNTDIPNILPHERVFPIQIGSELFRLSGASISSDGMYSNSQTPQNLRRNS
jgi:hypothetical protein